MKESFKLRLLQLDLEIPEDVIKIISAKYSLLPINFKKILKAEIINKSSEISLIINKYIDNGELIPEYVIQKFAENLFIQNKDKDLLLINFPTNTQNLNILNTLNSKFNFEIKNGWYIKQKNSNEFREHHLKNNKI